MLLLDVLSSFAIAIATPSDDSLSLGYVNYEFSSFAKPGYECKNNVTYWNRGKYIGFGPSAHSFDGVKRKWNISNNQKYIEKIKVNSIAYESEILSETDILNEIIMIGLRTYEGLDLDLIESKFSNLKTFLSSESMVLLMAAPLV